MALTDVNKNKTRGDRVDAEPTDKYAKYFDKAKGKDKDREWFDIITGAAKKGRPKFTHVAEKEGPLTEFENEDDFILSSMLIAIMHANPDMDVDDAVKEAKKWVARLHAPKTEHLWKNQVAEIRRFGVRAKASKIRRELYKLI